MNALKLERICAGYGEKEILRDISFTLPEGRSLAVLGPNGSGKSTLLRVIAGLLPSRGRLWLCGAEIHSLRRPQIAGRTALMSQFAEAAYPYTVYETVLLGRYLYRKKGLFPAATKRDHEVVRQCMADTGLTGLERETVTSLSGGQLQRVFLARTLAQEPRVILLDEPSSHLDLKYQAELSQYLKHWGKEKGRTVVSVMHDMTLAMQTADMALCLKDGRVEAFGSFEAVIRPGLLERVYGMDVAGYMHTALRRFEEVCHGE